MNRYLFISLLVVTTLRLAAQESPTTEPNISATQAASAAPPFSASLLLIKADWSQSPAAKEIEAELREALKDTPVPRDLLDRLPASAPDILFPPNVAPVYSTAHFGQLLAWLKSKELTVQEILFEVRVQSQRPMRGFGMLARPYDFLDLPQITIEHSQLFFQYELGFRWALRWDFPIGYGRAFGPSGEREQREFNVERNFAILEKARGQAEPQIKETLDSQTFSLAIPGQDEVLVFNSFIEPALRDAVRRKGFETLVIVRRGGPQNRDEMPRLVLPDTVRAIVVRQDRQFPFGTPGTLIVGTDGRSQFRAEAKPGSADQPTQKASGETPAPSLGDANLKVFRLSNANASQAGEIVQQLFGFGLLMSVAVDQRTNSLIVWAPAGQMEVITALLARLDEPLEARGGAGLYPSAVDELARQYEAKERQAAELAHQARQPHLDPGRAEARKAELRKVVAEAFAARQRLHQAELAQLQERMRQIGQTIEAKSRIRDQIIDRRVQELLNPALQWDGASQPAGRMLAPPPSQQAASETRPPPPFVPSAQPDLSAARAYRDKLRERWKAVEALYQAGRVRLEDQIPAANQLAEAEVAAASSRQERIAARKAQVARMEAIQSIVKQKYDNSVEPVQNLLAAEAAVLRAKAELEAEIAAGEQTRSDPSAPSANDSPQNPVPPPAK